MCAGLTISTTSRREVRVEISPKVRNTVEMDRKPNGSTWSYCGREVNLAILRLSFDRTQ
jgi:hypothetical protein